MLPSACLFDRQSLAASAATASSAPVRYPIAIPTDDGLNSHAFLFLSQFPTRRADSRFFERLMIPGRRSAPCDFPGHPVSIPSPDLRPARFAPASVHPRAVQPLHAFLPSSAPILAPPCREPGHRGLLRRLRSSRRRLPAYSSSPVPRLARRRARMTSCRSLP